MSGWLDLSQLGLAPNQKHQAFLGAPKIVHCGEPIPSTTSDIQTRIFAMPEKIRAREPGLGNSRAVIYAPSNRPRRIEDQLNVNVFCQKETLSTYAVVAVDEKLPMIRTCMRCPFQFGLLNACERCEQETFVVIVSTRCQMEGEV